ncbi:MAG: hypothetical protein KI790_00540 [Cyclobacteriaceae bacterium]|nr:hypothetical protein [Cyclobacteriaceae bacterium HetDA_MAG_MS6]
MIRALLSFCFIATACLAVQAQEVVQIIEEGRSLKTWKSVDTLDIAAGVREELVDRIREGYIFSAVDSIVRDSIGIRVYIHRGKSYDLQALQVSSSGQVYSSRPPKRPFQWAEAEVKALGRQGYPFAAIQFDSLHLLDKNLLFRISIDRGPKVENDSLLLKEQVPVNPSYLSAVLGLEIGEPFDEDAYQNLESTLQRIPFLRLQSEKDISFEEGKAKTFLDLKQERISSFEGIIGILPNQSDGGTLVTGFLNLDLFNLFRAGKELHLQWKRFDVESQTLDLSYKHPFLLGENVSLAFDLNLARQDSSFSKRNFSFSLSSFLSKHLRIQFSYESEASDLLDPEGLATGFLPLDYQLDWYKVSLHHGLQPAVQSFRDYKYAAIGFGVGQKDILKNNRLDPETYEGLDLETLSFELTGGLSLQKILGKSNTIANSLSFGWIRSNTLVENEFYRIGGLRTLRGFNEAFFFAQYFMVNQLEWRYFFEDRSYLMVYFDQGFVGNDIQDSRSWPRGFGGGIKLDTGNGQFDFIFALGQLPDNSISLSEVKIHLGYKALF